MISPLLLVLHLLAAVVWVGGMFLSHMALRPASGFLEVPERVVLWHGVFRRFFPWVWVAALVLPSTGYAMIAQKWGALMVAPLSVQLMHAIGWIMIGIFIYVFLRYFRSMDYMIKQKLYPEAGIRLLRIRPLMALNLALGLSVVVLAALRF
ncbi:MAG: CopD family protein [Magnetococcus sp. WYHC-3]